MQILQPGPLAAMGDALTARLQLVFPPAKFSHEVVPAKLDAREWKTLTRRTPFVGLGWNDIDNAAGARLFDGVARWTVFLVTKNPSNARSRYWGDALAPGLFSMVHGAVAGLNGFSMPGLGSASVMRSSNLYAEGWDDNDMAMAAVDVTVTLSFGLADIFSLPDGLDDFMTEATTWAFDTGSDANMTDLYQRTTP